MRASFLAVALVVLAAACVHATGPAPPAASPVTHSVVVQHSFPLERLTVCVVRDGILSDVSVSYDPATGDSVYEGRRFRDAFPTDSTVAAGTSWYDRDEMPVFNGRRYWSIGLPRVMRPGELVSRGTYRGLTVFVAPGTSSRTERLYLPVRPTCEFQAYETEMGGSVRGR